MSRYSAYVGSWLLLLLSIPLALRWPGWWWGVVGGALAMGVTYVAGTLLGVAGV